METKELVKNIYNEIDKKLGEDIIILNVRNICSIADFFVIASASNERQVAAISDSIEYELSKSGVEPKSVEGKSTAKWVLMDYGDIIVHIFKTEDREFYNLERLWKDAQYLTIDEL